MRFRNYWLLICIAIIGNGAQAQIGHLYFHLNESAIKSNAFQNFSESYNNYYSSTISKKIDPVRPGMGFGFGWMYSSEQGLKIGLEYNTTRSKTNVTFNDGAKREFKLRDGGVSLCFGYGYMPYVQRFYLYPVVGLTIGQSKFYTSYTPGDNNLSGAALDGKYKALALKSYLGINTAYGSDGAKLFVKIHYVFGALHEDLVDQDKYLNVIQNGTVAEDYEKFANDPYTYSGRVLRNDFHGFRFSLGVVFDIEK